MQLLRGRAEPRGSHVASRSEVSVAFVSNDGQLVYLVNILAEKFLILADTILVNTDSQTSTDFLTFGSGRIAMTERTNLEYIRVIPALTECRMGEDKAGGSQNLAAVLIF